MSYFDSPRRCFQSFQSFQSFQKGQSSIEYVVVCAALAFALGIGMVDDNSVLRELLSAFQTAYKKFSYALSLPT